MSSTQSEPKDAFLRKSEKESICMNCSATIRADRWTSLDVAEELHSGLCLLRAQSAVQYNPSVTQRRREFGSRHPAPVNDEGR
jgi:hypothetical protein